jgi:hypothetical protein
MGERIAHLRDPGAVEIEALVVGARVSIVGANDVAPAAVPERARDVVLQPVLRPEQVPGEAATKIVEDIAALLAADDGAGGPAERVHPGLDGDPIGVLDRRVVVDAQTRTVVEEDAFAAPERVILNRGSGDVIGAVHRIGGAVLGLGRRAGGIFLEVVDDAVVGVPGVGIVGLGGPGIAVVDVDLGVGDRGLGVLT